MAAMTCPACKRTDDGEDVEPSAEVVRCNDCGARVSFGKLMPRVVISPAGDDARFVVVSFDGAHFLLDKDLARAVGHNLQSIA